jgi:hypothetical protein
MPTKFDFLSPGIELREIDQSAVAAVPENDGILLIGRAKKGPAMKPIKITSLADFKAVFGNPMDGVKRGDPWREGNTGGGGWAAYAAEAYLAAEVGPVKFIRLAGVEEDGAGDADKAGWFVPTNDDSALNGGTLTEAQIEGAIGIYVAEDKALIPDAAATVELVVATATNALAGDTIVIQDHTGADITFTFVASSPSTQEIDLSALGLGTENQDLSNLLVALIDAEADLSASNSGGLTITISQPAGLDGNGKTVTEAFGGGGTTVFSTSLPQTFAGGTVITPSSNGVLAAIIYSSGSNVTLEGTPRDGSSVTGFKTAHAFKPASGGWSAQLDDGSSQFSFTFNFESTSQNFIRNVLSTDATQFSAGWNGHKIFLGESFENNVGRLTPPLVAWTAGLKETGKDFTDHRVELSPAKSGWFIGSKASNYKRLFRLAALDEGSDFHKTHIVRIKDLRKATTVRPEGSFTIEIARAGQRPSEYVEKFVNVTLNPDSPNYILKKIGDLKQEWNSSTGKIVSTGSFNNESNLIRVELAEGGVNKTDLPLGFLGPAEIDAATVTEIDATKQNGFVRGEESLPSGASGKLVEGLFTGDSITVSWPTHQLSVQNSAANGANYAPSAIHGLSYEAQRGNEDFADIGILKAGYEPHLAYTATSSDAAYTFSLENIAQDGTTGTYYHTNAFVVAFDDSATGALVLGIKQFAAPFFGGSDGVDIQVENPFNNTELTTGYAKYSMESAISQVADYYTSRYDLISIPGVTNAAINSLLVRQTEERGDALAIIDMVGIYVSEIDNGNGPLEGKVSTMVSTAEGGTVASSYAAAYYPNVRLADVSSGRGSVLMAPPSVAAIGAIAKSEAVSQPWFAPAGFNRGGLAPLGGVGGANVVGTLEHLSKADRDDLYNVNINPIARFPATGDTVIFGQKTLQPTDTALDRINVRRMMIYLKKRIGAISDQFLFEQGVKSTYDSFKAKINPILLQVKNEFGITDYKVVLDESTTTPDLQDRNIMYAKVFVKPAKAIEYVVIDFVVTQTGVEF